MREWAMREWPDGKPDWADGYVAGRRLDGDRWVILAPLTFGRLRVVLATPGGAGEHWCYDEPILAVASYLMYPREPIGWTRHMLPDGTMVWPERDDTVLP